LIASAPPTTPGCRQILARAVSPRISVLRSTSASEFRYRVRRLGKGRMRAISGSHSGETRDTRLARRAMPVPIVQKINRHRQTSPRCSIARAAADFVMSDPAPVPKIACASNTLGFSRRLNSPCSPVSGPLRGRGVPRLGARAESVGVMTESRRRGPSSFDNHYERIREAYAVEIAMARRFLLSSVAAAPFACARMRLQLMKFIHHLRGYGAAR